MLDRFRFYKDTYVGEEGEVMRSGYVGSVEFISIRKGWYKKVRNKTTLLPVGALHLAAKALFSTEALLRFSYRKTGEDKYEEAADEARLLARKLYSWAMALGTEKKRARERMSEDGE